jgi:sporulation protein YlmC with PRC-barrel domain
MPDKTVDLALSAPVHATDALVGRVEHVIINPETGSATHLVVREAQLPNALRLVAKKYIARTGPDGVFLSIPAKRLETLKEYIQTDYYAPAFFLSLAKEEHCKLPMAPSSWSVEHPATPEGFVALVGHEPVLATDGKVGRVDGVLADRHTGRVTHLLLRQGHLWGTREVQVPAGLVARYEDGQVVLSVDKAAVGALPDAHAA